MNVLEFFLENYVMLFELVGLVIMLGVSVHITKSMKRQTQIAILLLLAETVFFHLERWSQTFERLSLLRPMMTAAVYSIYPIVLILMTQITTTKKMTAKMIAILLIPEIVCVPLFFSSQWTHLVFWYYENNHYAGGALSRLPYFLFAFYIAVFLIHNFVFFKSYVHRDRLVVSYIVLGSAVGAAVYLLSDSGKDYSALFTSAIVLYFIFLYIHTAKIDPLTSLLNRQCYYQDTDSNSRSVTGVVSVDMNDLKYLNDSMGHEEGDLALRTVSDIMRKYCGKGGMVYRVGGDEFMILYTGTGEAEITNAIEEMRRRMEETPYICAFGCAVRQPGETIFDAARRSDAIMYENKARLKSLKAQSRETNTETALNKLFEHDGDTK